jgi:hypothetical protein
MATYTPPTEILPIFDSSVYVSDTTPLTVGEANKKYVKYPTAQGLSTFPSGIKTDLISPLTSTSNPTLFNDTSGDISIGSLSGLINIGTTSASSSIITLGNANTIVRALGSVIMNTINSLTESTVMNIGTLNTSGDINIGTNSARSGVLHLGNGTSSTGAVHINNGTSSTGNTQIMHGTGASGTLNLGNTAVGNSVVINVNRPLSLTYKPSVTSVGTLGYVYSPTYTWRTVANQSVASQALPIGVYMMTFSISLTGTFTALYLYISGVVLPASTFKFPLISTVANSVCSGSAIIRCNTAQTFDLIVSTNNSLVGNSNNGEVNIVRIG